MARLLVCDDATDVRMVVALALEMAGHRVEQADGGRAALDLLDADEQGFEALLLDVQMPDVDGWSVLSAIRRHERHHGLRVMMCTVKSDLRDLLRAWELGCDAYIVKPFQLDDLTDAVDAVLGRPEDDRIAWREDRLRQLRAMHDDPGPR